MGNNTKALIFVMLGSLLLGVLAAVTGASLMGETNAMATAVFVAIVSVLASTGLCYVMLLKPGEKAVDDIVAFIDSKGEVDVDSLPSFNGASGTSDFKVIRDVLSGFFSAGMGVAGHSGKIAISGAEVSHAADVLKKRIDDQVEQIQNITDSTTHISTNIEEAVTNSETLKDLARQTRRASYIGQEEVQGAAEQMASTGDHAKEAAQLINQLEERAGQISDITKVISGIADQTNLLALNAAIEAARAGEQGRGFAVVADEVRSLATRTSDATTEIGQMVGLINSETGNAASTMRELVGEVEDSRDRTAKIDTQLEEILEHAREVERRVTTAAERTERNKEYQMQINTALDVFSQNLNGSSEEVESVSVQSFELAEMAELVFDQLGDVGLRGEHKIAHSEAVEAVKAIQACFEKAVDSGKLTMDALFDRNYAPIPDTNPHKFSTRFDTFTDTHLPPIQEPILTRNGFMAYAGAVDNNGYFPTHNKRFAQPLTGDFDKDLLNNRTKRVFDDRTGSKCGSNTKAFLLQTYKRDTGEVMHDLSVPIYVSGRHWGGFRIGYQSRQ